MEDPQVGVLQEGLERGRWVVGRFAKLATEVAPFQKQIQTDPLPGDALF